MEDAGYVRDQEKEGMRCFLDDLRVFGYPRRPVDGCRPGRGGMAPDGRTRGETFHGEMDHCRESQGWATACSSIPERDGEDQGDDSPKRACSCWFARHYLTSGANL